MTPLSFASVALLVLVHLFVTRLHFLDRERWRSVAAGVAISYVFLDILPHLAAKQKVLSINVQGGVGGFIEHHSYLLALMGFAAFLGLARVVRELRIRGPKSEAPYSVIYTVLLAFAGYSLLIGYLIGEQPEHRYEPVIIFALAMSIHMAGVHVTLHERHPTSYERIFRYALAAATLTGWVLAVTTNVPEPAFALAFSFLAGAIIVVAAVFELPFVLEGGSYWLFVAGTAGFSALLLLYEAVARTNLAS